MIIEAERIQFIREYYFSKKLREISEMIRQGLDIINLGIGSPDLPPAQEIISTLQETASLTTSHGYQSYRGTDELRQAFAHFYKKYYRTSLNPKTQILPLTGSKEGIMHLSMAFINPGDSVLIPDPGYMTYTSATLLAGGTPVYYDLTPENEYLPDFDELEKLDLQKAKIMWVNYPHMPTGAKATSELFRNLAEFGKKHNILIVNDNPYSFILNENPMSLLSFSTDFEYIMELNSLSKSHNMAGWRIGMLAGKKDYIDAVMKFKSNMDSGMFLGLQKAAITALNMDKQWFDQQNKIYKERKTIAIKIYNKLKIRYNPEQNGMFLWGKLPGGITSEVFTDKLLKEKNIFLAPGFIFGKNGKEYVRLSLTNSTEDLTKALNRL